MAVMDPSHRELAPQLFADMSSRQFEAFVGGLGHVLIRVREELRAAREGER